MKYLKHWKYQCMWATPFIPWILIHHVNWSLTVAERLGFSHNGRGVMVGFLTIFAVIIFGVAYSAIHDGYDD